MSEVLPVGKVPPGTEIKSGDKAGIVLGRHPDGNHIVVSFRPGGITKLTEDEKVEVVEWP